MNLFDIAQEYMTVLQMAQDPETDPQVIHDTLEAIQGDLEDKLDSIAYVMAQIDGDIDTLDKEIERLQGRKASLKGNKDRLKEYTGYVMKLTGNMKVKTARHSYYFRKNPPVAVIDNENGIPDRFLIPQPPKVDKMSIKEYLKGMGDVKVQWAHLEASESLIIR